MFFHLTAKSPTPEPPEDSESLQPHVKTPLPPPQKDLDFLAEMERERLAEERRLKAFSMFQKLKKRVSFPKVKLDEVVSVEECKLLI